MEEQLDIPELPVEMWDKILSYIVSDNQLSSATSFKELHDIESSLRQLSQVNTLFLDIMCQLDRSVLKMPEAHSIPISYKHWLLSNRLNKEKERVVSVILGDNSLCQNIINVLKIRNNLSAEEINIGLYCLKHEIKIGDRNCLNSISNCPKYYAEDTFNFLFKIIPEHFYLRQGPSVTSCGRFTTLDLNVKCYDSGSVESLLIHGVSYADVLNQALRSKIFTMKFVQKNSMPFGYYDIEIAQPDMKMIQDILEYQAYDYNKILRKALAAKKMLMRRELFHKYQVKEILLPMLQKIQSIPEMDDQIRYVSDILKNIGKHKRYNISNHGIMTIPDVSLVELCLKNGADSNYEDGSFLLQALRGEVFEDKKQYFGGTQTMCLDGRKDYWPHLETIALLLEYGAKPDQGGRSSLAQLCNSFDKSDNAIKVLELLLEHGADPNKYDQGYGYPLNRLLVQHGRPSYKKSANNYLTMLRLLIGSGGHRADPNELRKDNPLKEFDQKARQWLKPEMAQRIRQMHSYPFGHLETMKKLMPFYDQDKNANLTFRWSRWRNNSSLLALS